MADKNLAIFDSTGTSIPTFAKETAGLGMENVDHNDMSTPQIKVLQGQSPELQENDNVKVGQLFNTVSKVAFDELLCVNLYYETHFSIFAKKARQRVDSANTLQEAQTIVAGLPGDPTDYEIQDTKVNYCVALSEEKDEKGNVVTDKDGHPVLTVMFPFIMYMKKTQVKVSNDWNTEINNRYGSQTARWAGVWRMTSRKRSNEHGTWYIPSIEWVDYVRDESLFKELSKTYQHITNKQDAA